MSQRFLRIKFRTAEGDALPSQKLGPGDLLSLSVSDCPELTRSFRINPQGQLKLQLLKEPISAAGKEPGEIEEKFSAL